MGQEEFDSRQLTLGKSNTRSIYVTKYKRIENFLRSNRNEAALVLDFLRFGGTIKARLFQVYTTEKEGESDICQR